MLLVIERVDLMATSIRLFFFSFSFSFSMLFLSWFLFRTKVALLKGNIRNFSSSSNAQRQTTYDILLLRPIEN